MTKTLRAKSKNILAAKEKQDALRLRNAYAIDLQTALLKKDMNPDGVSAIGVDKTTLHVDGWFCSRQFIYNADNGTIGSEARALGFKRIECGSALGSYWQDM